MFTQSQYIRVREGASHASTGAGASAAALAMGFFDQMRLFYPSPNLFWW